MDSYNRGVDCCNNTTNDNGYPVWKSGCWNVSLNWILIYMDIFKHIVETIGLIITWNWYCNLINDWTTIIQRRIILHCNFSINQFPKWNVDFDFLKIQLYTPTHFLYCIHQHIFYVVYPTATSPINPSQIRIIFENGLFSFIASNEYLRKDLHVKCGSWKCQEPCFPQRKQKCCEPSP